MELLSKNALVLLIKIRSFLGQRLIIKMTLLCVDREARNSY